MSDSTTVRERGERARVAIDNKLGEVRDRVETRVHDARDRVNERVHDVRDRVHDARDRVNERVHEVRDKINDTLAREENYLYTRPLLVGYGLTTSQAYATRAIAALASGALTTPFDVVQTLAQVGSKEGRKSYKRIIEDIWEKEGFTGFFRGAFVGSLRFVETAVVNYVVYYVIKKALADELGHLSESHHQIANAASIIVSSILTYPLEVIKTRLILDFDHKKYPGAMDAFLDTINTEGWSGLFSGAVLSAVGNYAMIEIMERIWTPLRLGLNFAPPRLVDAVAQSLLAQTIYYPIDTVIKMIQAPHVYKKLHPDVPFDGAIEAATATVSKHGLLELWRGYAVSAFKVVPYIVLTSLTYQITADAFTKLNFTPVHVNTIRTVNVDSTRTVPVGTATTNTRVERLA